MTRRTQLAAASCAVLVAAIVGAQSVYAAFSRTTSSAANSFSAGTVALGDNDGGSALLTLTSVTPGASDTGCIKVTYTGTLNATVRLYATVSGGLAPYLNLTVTRGTDSSPSFDSCAGFTADGTDYLGSGAGVVYSGTLGGYPTSAAAAFLDPKTAAPATWSTNTAHSYKFVVTLANDNAAQGLSATADFQWEARNQ